MPNAGRNPRAIRRAPARLRVVLGLGLLVLAAFQPLAADPPDDDAQVIRGVEIGAPVTPYVYDGNLGDLPRAPEWRPGDPIKSIPMRHYFPPGREPRLPDVSGPDPLVEAQRSRTSDTTRGLFDFGVPTRSFAGLGYTGVNPPDTVGDVGPNHFIQSVNTGGGADVRIWDKAVPTPNQLASFRLDALGSAACASGFGDPIVLYDRQADRWILTEFSTASNDLCVYVSQTPDPVAGGWYAYNFDQPDFPDYPKYAVWATDANGGSGSYIVTANDSGPGVVALDRGAMLAGLAATFQRLVLPELPGFGIQAPTPAHTDGALAPVGGSPALIMRHRDTEVHGGPSAPGDLLELWFFDVDWQDSGNTTLTPGPSLDVAEFDSTVCGLSFTGCFAQPGSGTTLMPIREPIMNRLQYYNQGAFESLLGNFVVDADGADQGGVRWFEARRNGGAWLLHQEGTYAIDDDNRWMGAIAMDQAGNIALAYNVVSSTTFPSLRYTGRRFDDPPGVMTEPESTIHAGTASNASIRYGDYAAMGLDPTDGCTFWFTGMDNASSSWRTHAASFRFDTCGCDRAPTTLVLDAQAAGPSQVDLLWDDADLETVVEYSVLRSRTPGGPYETIAVLPDSSPGNAAGPGYSFSDSGISGQIEYSYAVVATDGGACRSAPLNEVSVLVQGPCTLSPVFAGLTHAASAAYETCTVELSWDPAIAECGGPVLYNVYRSTTAGFTPGPSNLLVAGVPGTSVADVNDVQDDTQLFYVVRAIDLANGHEEPNVVERSVESAGPDTGLFTVLSEDFDVASDFDAWTVLTGPGQHSCGAFARSSSSTERPGAGSGSYARALSMLCQPLFPRTSTTLESPAIDLDIVGLQSATLDLDLYYDHRSGDDATIQVWNGSAWQVIWTDPNADVNTHLNFDVTAAAVGNGAFRIRFDYQNAVNSGWYSVDDVTVVIDVDNPCFTGAAPPSVADGTGSAPPLLAARLDPGGDTLELQWDVSCVAQQYNVLWGDLAAVGSHAPLGSACSTGSTGQFTWTAVPSGDLWFLVVGSDAAGTESSWGRATFGERNGLDASGECAMTSKDISAICQ